MDLKYFASLLHSNEEGKIIVGTVIEIEPIISKKKRESTISGGIKKLFSYIDNPDDKEKIKLYSKIYSVHKYWSRKPWYPIAECIKKYSKAKDTIVDMFMGSGVTGLEAIIQERDFIGYDLNPMSIFIAENTLNSNFNIKEFNDEIALLKGKIDAVAADFYSVDDKCGDCGSNLMIKHANIGPKHKGKETAFLFCYTCGTNMSKVVRKLKKNELENSYADRRLRIKIPDAEFPKRFYKDRFSYKGISNVSDMYTRRNYCFLGILNDIINKTRFKYQHLFLTAFSNTVLHASKLKSENVRPLNVNNYWIPDDYFEENPWFRFLERINLIIDAKSALLHRINGKKLGRYRFFNKSCFQTGLDSASVDYILTDPPYGDAIQYSELSFIWNSWLGFHYDNKNEVVINPAQDKNVDDFLLLLDQSVKESARILKKGKFYTLCFHNKEFHIWKGVLDVFKRNNFVLEKIDIVDTKGNPYNSNWATFSPKVDLYLTFRKGEYKPRFIDEHGIIDFMHNLLSEITIDDPSRLYDLVSVNLIYDLYFNEHQVDVNGLSMKTIFNIYKQVKSGN